ncbi:MAG: endo-1,4-beta-xylanase [Deltaproteobacteria bacterium]
MKSTLRFGGVGTLWAGALLGCGSDSAIAMVRPETEVSALKPVEPTQLLAYDCRQDGAKKSTPPGSAASLPKTLRQAERVMGVAVNATGLEDPAYAQTVSTQFSQLTPENEMKWEAIEPEPGVFDFSRADAIVAFAAQNDMQVRGHTLVWHSQLAPWVEALTGADAVRAALTQHIQGVVSHFRDTFPGTVVAYDVVNEAVNVVNGQMGGMPTVYRDSLFYRELGEGFIAEAFQIAHDTDPDALLFYNEFGAEGMNGAKSTAMYNMVSGLVAAGVPIDGVGLQMHTGPTDQGPGAADLQANIARYAALGLKVEITEMDVSLCTIGSNTLGLELQRFRYNRIVSACFSSPACRSVSVWGLSDPNSWLNSNGCTQGMITLDTQPAPLVFDEAFGRKPAWWGIYDGLTGCDYQ